MSHRSTYLAMLLLGLAGLWACWCDTAMLWDGAYQFCDTLIAGRPFSFLSRFHSWLVWQPLALVAPHTDNYRLLRMLYGLPFCMAPLTGVALSWWLLRGRAPHLMVWVLFGTALAPLPGQIFMINDSIFQLHLFWPVLLAPLLPLRRIQAGVIAAVSLFQLSHPMGIGLCVFAAAVAFLVRCCGSGNFAGEWGGAGAKARAWVVWLLVLAFGGWLKLVLWPDNYAASEATLAQVMNTFVGGVRGLPLLGLMGIWVAGALLLPKARVAGWMGLCLVLLAGAVWLVWGLEPQLWRGALNYRRWVAPAAFPFMLAIAWESRRGGRVTLMRSLAGVGASVIFLLVLGAQAAACRSYFLRMSDGVARTDSGWVPASAFPWMQDSALEHWGLAAQVIMVQGRHPHTLLADEQSLAAARENPPRLALKPMDDRMLQDFPKLVPMGQARWAPQTLSGYPNATQAPPCPNGLDGGERNNKIPRSLRRQRQKNCMHGSSGNIIWTLCYFVVLSGLSLYGLHRYVIVYLYWKYRKQAPVPLAQFEELPRITVQLPVFNEMYVVERLLKSVAELDYPRELLQVQVLDDSTDETTAIAAARVQELRQAGLDIELIHRTDRTGFKAGALEHGLKTCRGEFILILDADFVPTPDMLQRTIHYFTDPKIGMIQTRWGHLNRTYSLLTRVQAMFLDGHLLLEQTARSRSGRFFNFNGTGGLWRRTCIAEAGGWQHDTLTEDLDLSYRAQLKGWRFIFLSDLVTPAELPVDMNGFKSQQHRWTKGSIQTCAKLLPTVWRARLPLLIKLEATAHLTSNYAYLLLFFLCLLLHPSVGGTSHGSWRQMLLDIAIFFSASAPAAVFYICTQRELHPRTWLKEILLLPALLALGIGLAVNNARAVLEAMLGHQSEFKRTPKYGIERNTQSWKRSQYVPIKTVLPFVELAFAAYFSYFLVTALMRHQWLSIPFLCLFMGGFSYVALCSLAQWIPGLRFPGRDTGDRLAA